jgi:hypothetical protein
MLVYFAQSGIYSGTVNDMESVVAKKSEEIKMTFYYNKGSYLLKICLKN